MRTFGSNSAMGQNKSLGYFEEVRPDGTVVRGETFTCAHCGNIFEIIHGQPFAMCHREMKPVCQKCHAVGTCIPFEKRIKATESRAALRKAILG